MSNNEIAVIWRNDGVIHYVIPHSILVNTFFATVLRHDPWLCPLVNELAMVVAHEIEDAGFGERRAKVVAAILAGLMSSGDEHSPIDPSVSRLKIGTADHFPGMFYGTMHPTELAVLGNKMEEVIEITEESGVIQTAEDRAELHTVECWIVASQKFVRPAEQMGLMGEAGKA